MIEVEARFKNILCEVSGDGDFAFMLDDEYGTVVDGCELYAVDDEFLDEDLEAAKAYVFDTIPVYQKEGFDCRWLRLL